LRRTWVKPTLGGAPPWIRGRGAAGQLIDAGEKEDGGQPRRLGHEGAGPRCAHPRAWKKKKGRARPEGAIPFRVAPKIAGQLAAVGGGQRPRGKRDRLTGA